MTMTTSEAVERGTDTYNAHDLDGRSPYARDRLSSHDRRMHHVVILVSSTIAANTAQTISGQIDELHGASAGARRDQSIGGWYRDVPVVPASPRAENSGHDRHEEWTLALLTRAAVGHSVVHQKSNRR